MLSGLASFGSFLTVIKHTCSVELKLQGRMQQWEREAVAFVYMGGGGGQEAEVTRKLWTSNKQTERMEGVAVWMLTLLQRQDRDWKPSAKLFNPAS